MGTNGFTSSYTKALIVTLAKTSNKKCWSMRVQERRDFVGGEATGGIHFTHNFYFDGDDLTNADFNTDFTRHKIPTNDKFCQNARCNGSATWNGKSGDRCRSCFKHFNATVSAVSS